MDMGAPKKEIMQEVRVASIIFAAGYGSRMKGFSGNKTILPLIPVSNPFNGKHPIIFEIIKNLPKGPKALVLHHKREEVVRATRDLDILYYDQPVPNGTGGALISAQGFLEQIDQKHLIITMGDIPFVKEITYRNIVGQLEVQDLVVLGFKPMDKAQYGVLEIEGGNVKKITEWGYWKEYPLERQAQFEVFNSGIYAVSRSALIKYLKKLKQRPHKVEKKRDGQLRVVEEYFMTDLVELMSDDGLKVGFTLAEEENEVLGVDTLEDLILAQSIFAKMNV